MSEKEEILLSLDLAEWQYKLTIHITPWTRFDETVVHFSYGKHCLGGDDLRLDENQKQLAVSAIKNTVINSLAIVIDTALEKTFSNRFEHPDPLIVKTSRIARLLRNAFSHDMFFPRWTIEKENLRTIWSIENVIIIDATNLHGEEVIWQHYGGQLALLNFLQLCRKLITSAN